MEARTVHDPFTGQDVQISNRLVDRLRGKYASGPHLPNGIKVVHVHPGGQAIVGNVVSGASGVQGGVNPEFGWRQFQAPPIQHEAAARIEALEARIATAGALASQKASHDMIIDALCGRLNCQS